MTGRAHGAVAGTTGRWLVEERVGAAVDLHAPWPPPTETDRPRLAVCLVSPPGAVVLGSAQGLRPRRPEDGPAAATVAAGLPVVRRRSGGGAVVVRPGQQVWVDVWVPRGDPRWDDDVVVAAGWVGEAWARALADVGVAGTVVHRGGVGRRAHPDAGGLDQVCFAGVGPGEVLVGDPPRKVVGLSQHRARPGARFLTMAVRHWDPAGTVDALAALGLLGPAGAAPVAAAAASSACGLVDVVTTGTGDPLGAVTRAVVARLTQA